METQACIPSDHAVADDWTVGGCCCCALLNMTSTCSFALMLGSAALVALHLPVKKAIYVLLRYRNSTIPLEKFSSAKT